MIAKLALIPFVALCVLDCLVFTSDKNNAGDRDAVKRVPLQNIYSTTGQKSSIYIRGVKDDTIERLLPELTTQAIRMGASNVFLARGDDVTSAVRSTWEVFCQGHPVNTLVRDRASPQSTKNWLIAYLGVHASDRGWRVTSVEIERKTIRLTFDFKAGFNNDRHPFLLWIPLGHMEPGVYSLELFDRDRGQVDIVRRVVVERDK